MREQLLAVLLQPEGCHWRSSPERRSDEDQERQLLLCAPLPSTKVQVILKRSIGRGMAIVWGGAIVRVGKGSNSGWGDKSSGEVDGGRQQFEGEGRAVAVITTIPIIITITITIITIRIASYIRITSWVGQVGRGWQ